MRRFIFAALFILPGCEFGKKEIGSSQFEHILPGFALKESASAGDSNFKMKSYSGAREGRVLEITLQTPVDKKRATEIMDAERRRVESVFQVQRLPYPGSVSQISGCPGRTEPAIDFAEGEPRLSVRVAANSRFVYGGCGPDEQVYDLFEVMIHCGRESALIAAKLFVKRAGGQAGADELKALTCAGLAR